MNESEKAFMGSLMHFALQWQDLCIRRACNDVQGQIRRLAQGERIAVIQRHIVRGIFP